MEKVDVKPHRAVCLSLLAWNGMQKVKIMRRPKPIPAADPYGPFLPPPDWQDLQEAAGAITSKDDLDRLTASFLGRFEEELVCRHDLIGQKPFHGRAKGHTVSLHLRPRGCQSRDRPSTLGLACCQGR